MSKIDPTAGERETAKRNHEELRKRFPSRQFPPLSQHEMLVVGDMIDPRMIDTTLDSLGGLRDQIKSLKNKVMKPLENPQVFSTPLLGTTRGILLYGPPGTGKTLLAKALAKESGATFINVRASSVHNKWFGETNKLIAAIFSLARKFEPSIIFIDEVDALLGRRGDAEQDFVTAMKTEFMQHWEGMTTDPNSRVIVLAATNRPDFLDDAVKRRFPDKFHVGMPTADERLEIVWKTLLREAATRRYYASLARGAAAGAGEAAGTPHGVDQQLLHPGTFRQALAPLVPLTDGFSGSDLFNVCREAAQAAAEAGGEGERDHGGMSFGDVQPITLDVLKEACLRVRPSSSAMMPKEDRINGGEGHSHGGGVPMGGLPLLGQLAVGGTVLAEVHDDKGDTRRVKLRLLGDGHHYG